MDRYKLSLDAKEDLKNIYRHGVIAFGVDQTEGYIHGLMERFETIAANPFQYPDVAHIRANYRRSVYGRESIYYRIVEDQVEIMRLIGQQNF